MPVGNNPLPLTPDGAPAPPATTGPAAVAPGDAAEASTLAALQAYDGSGPDPDFDHTSLDGLDLFNSFDNGGTPIAIYSKGVAATYLVIDNKSPCTLVVSASGEIGSLSMAKGGYDFAVNPETVLCCRIPPTLKVAVLCIQTTPGFIAADFAPCDVYLLAGSYAAGGAPYLVTELGTLPAFDT